MTSNRTVQPSNGGGMLSSIGLSQSGLRSALPILTGTLALLGVGGGLYNFVDPVEGAAGFGIKLQSSATEGAQKPSPTELAYIRVHGIRNMGNCLGLLVLSSFAYYAPICKSNAVVGQTARKMVGILMLTGCYTGFVDSWIISQFAESKGISSDAAQHAREKSQGHAVLAVPTVLLALAWFFS